MNKKGFTMIELLAVVVILAILVVFAVPNVIKVYNKSLENQFITQVKATARNAETYAVLNDTENTFNCSSFEKGDTYDECTVVKKDNELIIDALGKGRFSNFLMIDVNKKTGEGQFVNLKDLNTINIIESNYSKNSIENGELGGIILTPNKMRELALEEDADDAPTSEEYGEWFNYRIENGKFIRNDYGDWIWIVAKITIDEPGKYVFTSSNPVNTIEGFVLTVCESIYGDNSVFESFNYKDKYIVEFSKPGEYYIKLDVLAESYDGFNISSKSSISNLKLNGDKIVYLKPSQVSSYKDAGIMFNGTKLTGNNNYYEYTNLTDKEGTYKYNYIVKTQNGIKKISRTIIVLNYTSETCFDFNSETKTILNYDESCPRDVVIPPTINGIEVEVIADSAFYGCHYEEYGFNNTNNKYSVKRVSTIAGASCSPKINSVILPSTLKEIDDLAFAYNNITSIVIPSSITSIGYFAFGGNPLNEVDVRYMGVGCNAFGPLTDTLDVNNLCSYATVQSRN